MKIKISDMMDHVACIPIDLQKRGEISTDQVKKTTLEKIHDIPSKTRSLRNIPKAGFAVAALALCISITALAARTINWNGFAYMDGLSGREKKALLQDATTAYAMSIANEADGSVHYLDKDGKEILVLSAEEAAEYEAAQRAEKEQAVRESTSLVDVSTLPLLPVSITEMETTADGQFSDFMLGNGHMTLLHPDSGNSYVLTVGDTVTIMLKSNDECSLEFDIFQDGIFIEKEVLLARQHLYTFTASEDGLYNFSITYFSAGASIFTDCKVMVNENL